MARRPPRPSRDQAEEQLLAVFSAYSPLSAMDYAELSGLNPGAAKQRLDTARRAGLVHYAGWQRHPHKPSNQFPLFALGRGTPAPRLPKVPKAQILQDYRANLKADKRRYAKYLAKRRKFYQEQKKNDPMFVVKLRTAKREAKRRRFGHQPRPVRLPDVSRIDPTLAAMMGCSAPTEAA